MRNGDAGQSGFLAKFDRVKRLMLQPKSEFEVISAERETLRGVFFGWVVLFVSIMMIANAIRALIFGISSFDRGLTGGQTVELSYLPNLVLPVFFLSLFMPFVMAAAINVLAGLFGGQRDYVQAFRTAAYCGTPAWIIGIFGTTWHRVDPVRIAPSPSIALFVGALWGVFLLYCALRPMMKARPGRVWLYCLVVVVIMTGVWGLALAFTYGLITKLDAAWLARQYPDE
jgi:hypothetical protein